jgi:hypothetical protein
LTEEVDHAKVTAKVMTVLSTPQARVTPAVLVQLSGEEVWWQQGLEKETVCPGDEMLTRFCTLADGGPDALSAFVWDYGGLALCEEHGLPSTHRRPGLGEAWCLPKPDSHGWYREPIDTWRRYAREASALLALVDKIVAGDEKQHDFDAVCRPFDLPAELVDLLRHGETSEAQQDDGLDWSHLEQEYGPWKPPDEETTRRDPEASAYFLLNWLAGRWLKLGNVSVQFGFEGHRVVPRLVGDGMFGSLALQLSQEVTRRLDRRRDHLIFAQCSECEKTYHPDRQPPRGKNNYCPDCRSWANNRNKQRRYRQRQREKGSQ